MINLQKKEEFFLSSFNEVSNTLKKCGIRAWVDAGILLKYYRKEKIFPSSDIDFGIKFQNLSNISQFVSSLKKKKYKISTIGNTDVLFEGLTLKKFLNEEFVINIDLYIYYPVKNFLCRPNMHKPLKQKIFSVFLFILLNKFNKYKKNFVYLKYLHLFTAKIYFRYAQTTQFGIPAQYLNHLKEVKTNKSLILVPKQTKEYILWRYGPKWNIKNKNWRLTDGKMVFLNNLKLFWKFYISAEKFDGPSLTSEKRKSKKKSIFEFSQIELQIIKASKINSQLY